MKPDHLIEPRNPSKNSATRFYFKVAPSSISKTKFHFRLQLLPSLQIILYFHVVLKKNNRKKKTFQAARPSCSVVHLNQRLQWNSSKPSVYVHMRNRNESCGNFYSGLTDTEIPDRKSSFN